LVPPFETPTICEPPKDTNMNKLIDDIAEKTVKGRNDFLAEFMKKPEVSFNPIYQFLFGGEYSNYFRW
jgi:hypothetical protein